MTVTILYLARLREDLGTSAETIELPPGVTTVEGLRTHLMARGGAWRDALADNRALSIAVNHDIARPGTPIKPGDEVAFFPPVTGG
jgi:molybdopterin synthase sulfur carrier subunit